MRLPILLLALAAGVPSHAATVKITISATDYVWGTKTGTLFVNLNDTVEWKNADSAPHTVTASGTPPAFDSGNIAPGATWSRTFTSTGAWDYACVLQPGVRGRVVVRQGKVVNINIQSFAFGAGNAPVTVDAGDTVRWTNKDNIAHTTTSAVGTSGPRVADGKYFDNTYSLNSTFSYTFCQAGSYPYFCKPHFSMTSQIMVNTPFLKGDLDSDGAVGLGDVRLAMEWLSGAKTAPAGSLARGDVAPQGAPDGRFDLRDASRLVRFASGLDSTPL